MNRQKSYSLLKALWTVVDEVANAQSVDIAPGCEQYLRDFIEEGVKKLILEGFKFNSDRINLAKDNLRHFMTIMVVVAKKEGENVLHENTYFAAIKLCPFWPFC